MLQLMDAVSTSIAPVAVRPFRTFNNWLCKTACTTRILQWAQGFGRPVAVAKPPGAGTLVVTLVGASCPREDGRDGAQQHQKQVAMGHVPLRARLSRVRPRWSSRPRDGVKLVPVGGRPTTSSSHPVPYRRPSTRTGYRRPGISSPVALVGPLNRFDRSFDF